MKIARNASDVAAAANGASALRSRGSFARHPSVADLASEHSLFATLSRSLTVRSASDPSAGGFTSMLVGIGALVCLLLCVGTLLARSEKHEDDDAASSSDDTERVGGQPSTGSAKVRRASTTSAKSARKGLFHFLPTSGRSSPGRYREARDLPTSSGESDSDVSSQATSRKPRDAGGNGSLFAETIRLRDRQALEVDMGVSGMALASDKDDVRPVLLIASQAFCLQAMILWYIWATLLPRPNSDTPKDLPLPLVVAAIYLHFVMCVRDLPQSMLLMRHFMRGWSFETLVFGTIFCIDALVVPLVQLFVGALFLCTSMTVADVILNACAVNFISTIDNTILEVYRALNELIEDEDDSDQGKMIELHVPTKLLRVINWTGCIIPIVPGMFSMAMAHVGLDIWKL